MPDFRMVVRRTTEEQFEFTMSAESDVAAHQEMAVPGKLDTICREPVSHTERVTVIECHRVGGGA